MVDPTYYCVQVFIRDGGRLSPSALKHYPSADEACERAERAASDAAGAIAFEFQGRPEHGIWGEPKLLKAFGSVASVAS